MDSSMNKEMIFCPKCGSWDVSLYIERPVTYHCDACDYYWLRSRPFNTTPNQQWRLGGHDSSWNGYTDPDDFPTDGLDGGGW